MSNPLFRYIDPNPRGLSVKFPLLAGGEGFEPPILGPEPSALPLAQSLRLPCRFEQNDFVERCVGRA